MGIFHKTTNCGKCGEYVKCKRKLIDVGYDSGVGYPHIADYKSIFRCPKCLDAKKILQKRIDEQNKRLIKERKKEISKKQERWIKERDKLLELK